MPPIMTKGGGLCFGFPDVCLVPASPSPVPTPFLNIGDCTIAEGTVSKVRIENAEVLVETSVLPSSTGDEAGTLGGVISGTFGGCVKFKTASAKVYARGKRAVLLNGVSAHNGDPPNVPVGQVLVPSQIRVIASS
ncbi:MAG: DUF4150 domain-containing protein [Polyangiaceae bacterium]|nr:DUF4150 domain-containing protein [Polyangiaceae bacterium]